MSHLKERTERNCLNCNAELTGRYCHVCGQENLEPVESAWHLITHFFQDITHFDGKFFSTLKLLLLRPGFLSTEYRKGRRAAYLNPVRMYIFTSAVFFLIFFSISHIGESEIKNPSGKNIVKGQKDSVTRINAPGMDFEIGNSKKDSVYYSDSAGDDEAILLTGENFKDRHTYDSLLKTGTLKHSWLKRVFVYKEIDLREKYSGNSKAQVTAFVNNLLHSFPQMLFISLPIFALMLKLLYVRRKNYFYANHAIFSIHLYVFVFILLLLCIGISELNDYLRWGILNWLLAVIVIYIFYYQYRSMRNFYLQGKGKTFLKFLLQNFLMFVVTGMLMLIFMILSLFKL